MLTKAFALIITVTFAALALEVVFGVHLGIASWVDGLLGAGRFALV
jgi:hypothetical protein